MLTLTITSTDDDQHDERLTWGLGRRIRRLRDRQGLTADQIAKAAGTLGLRWRRSTVATIEAGRRALTVEEFVLLPLVFHKANGRLGWRDLFGSSAPVQGVRLTADDLPALTTGDVTKLAARASARALLDSDDYGQSALDLLSGSRADRMVGEATIELATRREAEQKVARRLGVPADKVVRAAFRIWDGGLTEERDRRAWQVIEPSWRSRVEEGLEVEAWLKTAWSVARRKVTQSLMSELCTELGITPPKAP